MSFFKQQKKIVISTTINVKEYNICKERRLKYNYVFSEGLKSIMGVSSLSARLQETEQEQRDAVKTIERLLGRIRALEEANANK